MQENQDVNVDPTPKESPKQTTIEKFNLSQRRFLTECFKDALVNSNPQGEDYFKRLGPSIQAVMRDAVQFICTYKPLSGKITEEKLDDGSPCEFVTFEFPLYQPGTNDKIILNRKFTLSYFENQ